MNNMFDGKILTNKEYHERMSEIYTQYEDGLLSHEEANKAIFLTIGEHNRSTNIAQDVYLASRIEYVENPAIDLGRVAFRLRSTSSAGKIEVIKAIRATSNTSLREAKEYAEKHEMEITEGYGYNQRDVS